MPITPNNCTNSARCTQSLCILFVGNINLPYISLFWVSQNKNSLLDLYLLFHTLVINI